MNNISITGRLVRDVELQETATEVAYTRFSVAVPSETKDENGKRIADFFVCVAWRDHAKNIAKHFKKGSPIELFGSMNSRIWERDGQSSTIWELNVKGWSFPQTTRDEPKNDAPMGEKVSVTNKPTKGEETELTPLDDDDDDMPF